MSRHRSLRLTLAASVIAVVAACSGSAPAAPALTDPVDILAQSVQTLQDVKSFHADVAVSGSVNVDVMGTGSTAGVPARQHDRAARRRRREQERQGHVRRVRR